MKQTLSKDTFRFLFNQIRPNNFSYEGQGVLFDWLEQIEQDTGTEFEFDPIALCCDFSQCSLKEFMDSYDVDLPEVDYLTYEQIKNSIEQYLDKNGFFYEFVEDDKEVIFQNI